MVNEWLKLLPKSAVRQVAETRSQSRLITPKVVPSRISGVNFYVRSIA